MGKKHSLRIAIIAGLLFLALAGIAAAHAPSKLVLTYEAETNILLVRTFHGVGNPEGHYIKSFSLSIDGKKTYELRAWRQTNSSEAIAVFRLPALEKGTVLTVRTICNRGGSGSEELIVK